MVLRRLTYLLLLLTTGMAAAVLSAGNAQAISVFDTAYATTDSIRVYKAGEVECDKDVTSSWAKYILDKNRWHDLTQISNPSSQLNQMRDSFISTLIDPDGVWWVGELEDPPSGEKRMLISWTQTPASYIQWKNYGAVQVPIVYAGAGVRTAMVACSDQYGDEDTTEKLVSFVFETGNTGKAIADNTWILKNLFLHANNTTFNYNYPVGYEGPPIATDDPMQAADNDNDGLTALYEARQGTFDFNKDSDGDGIDDLKESELFEDRDIIFCGITECAYPNPTKKNLFVEVDWLKDSSSVVYKPSPTQFAIVEAMFNDKDVVVHFDTGQYGGGEEIAVSSASLVRVETPSVADFFDYKEGIESPSHKRFSEDREGIWRYMITGYNYPESMLSTGWAAVMSDAVFISYGAIVNESSIDPLKMDRAVAGTIAHELGHSLCLSSEKIWEEQSDACIFDGIDDLYSLDYRSVMNYNYQLTNHYDLGGVTLSNGNNGSSDHDDWPGALAAMDGFSGIRTSYSSGADTQTSNVRTDRGIVEEPPVADPTGENKQKIEEYMRTHGQSRIDQPAGSENMATPADNSPTANDEYIIEEDRIEPIADNSQAQLNRVLIIAAIALGSVVLAAGIVTIVKRKK